MLEFFNQIDTVLFVLLNIKMANPVFDVIMPFITYRQTWYPVWIILAILLLWKGGKKGRWVILIALLSVASADQIVVNILKPFFHRTRPCNVVDGVHLLVGNKKSLSMPSAHAANFFATATVFAYFYRKYQVIFWFIASAVAYSRIAVGVHYPFDTLVGGLVGSLLGVLWIVIIRKIAEVKGQTILE